jgi:hypothetical protein
MAQLICSMMTMQRQCGHSTAKGKKGKLVVLILYFFISLLM